MSLAKNSYNRGTRARGATISSGPQEHEALSEKSSILLQNEQILEGMPDGVVLLDSDNTILWGNGRLREWSGRDIGGRGELLRRPGQPGDPRPRFLSLPHGAGHRAGHQFDAAEPGQPLLPGPRRAGPRGGRPAAAPDRHRPRRDRRDAAAAEAGRHPPGRHGTGRPDARRSLPDVGRGADRAAEVEHPALHQGPAALRRRRDPPAGPEDQPAGAAAVRGHGARGRRPRALRPAAEQRRDRLRGRHRQELPLRRHDRGPALPGRAPRAPRVR